MLSRCLLPKRQRHSGARRKMRTRLNASLYDHLVWGGLAMSIYGLSGRIYDGLVFLFTLGKEEPFIRESVKRLDLRAGDRVLDWGCGTGTSLKFIQSFLSEGRVYAVDQSEKMAKYAVARSRPNKSLDYHFMLREGIELSLGGSAFARKGSAPNCSRELTRRSNRSHGRALGNCIDAS